MRRRLVLHCPDIALKGRNQRDFRQVLVADVRHRLAALGLKSRVGATRGRLHVETTALAPVDTRRLVEALARVPGIASLGDAVWLSPAQLGRDATTFNWRLLEDTVVELAAAAFEPDLCFAVDVKRVDKALAVGSVEAERRLGAAIRARTKWDRVDLERPDREFHVDAYPDGIYVYPERFEGVGGLPVGTLGHVLALLSGGIDSPVAAFMLARRGCRVDALHVTPGAAEGFDPEAAQVARLARTLSLYAGRMRLYVVPDIHFDLALRGAPAGHELVLFRRFLLRVAAHLAMKIRAPAAVLGDSLGQVASQTLENLLAADAAVDLPAFRPLLGFHKQEIIALARRLGTYDISIEPHRDCCTLLARNPRTRLGAGRVAAVEAALIPAYGDLLARTFADLRRLEFDCGRLRGVRAGFRPG